MRYTDDLYGEVDIEEDVLVALLESDALGRARNISQHGVTAILGITPPFSRFDHSVGAMLLVRRLGASLEEQAAALLHDVSHTAFSHVIDFVFDDHHQQCYHEVEKENFVRDSDIPEILETHGLDWRTIIDESHFSLLEQPAPALCADRLDYFLRDLVFMKLANERQIRAAISALAVHNGQIVVTRLDVAQWLAYTFIETDRASWSNFRAVGLYQLAAEAIKEALKNGVIGQADIWGSDQGLWQQLCTSQDPGVRQWMRLLSPGTRFLWDEVEPQFRVRTKLRTIDPLVTVAGCAKPLSAISPEYGRYRDEYIASKSGIWPMRAVPGPEPVD